MVINSEIVIIYILFPYCDFKCTVKPFAVSNPCTGSCLVTVSYLPSGQDFTGNSEYLSIIQTLLSQLVEPVYPLWHSLY